MMLIRIVRMGFKPEKVEEFIAIFNEVKPLIMQHEGCRQLQLYRDHTLPNVFYTHSLWESHESLEAYRQSEFFRATWERTKKLFADKPRVFSLIQS